MIFKNLQDFQKMTTKARCICLTATTPRDGNSKLEQKIYEDLGLKSLAYVPNNMPDQNEEMATQPLPNLSNDQFVEHVREISKEQAVLIYTDVTEQTSLLEKLPWSEKVSAETDAASLRELDMMKTDQHYRVLVASDVGTMRGVDLRAPTRGLVLVIRKGFASERDKMQALTRVGRQGDKCERFISRGLSLIDKELEEELVKRLIQFRSGPIKKGRGAKPNVPSFLTN